eukprot:8037412-Prorocentrum_lima.AAC.1
MEWHNSGARTSNFPLSSLSQETFLRSTEDSWCTSIGVVPIPPGRPWQFACTYTITCWLEFMSK